MPSHGVFVTRAALSGGVEGDHATKHEEHEGHIEDEEDDGVPVVLEVELNHGFTDGFATALKRGQAARVEAVVSFVTLEQYERDAVEQGQPLVEPPT